MAEKVEILEQVLELTFTQDNDCVQGGDSGQFLKIKTADGGGGDFFIIETNRWAFNTIEDFIRILYTFKEKHEKIKTKEKNVENF